MVIAGPTAAGKTALAIELANRFGAEIVSADSRQFYREMNIGTAKPDALQMASAPHHMINNKSVTELYGAGHFETDALMLIAELHKKNDVVILAGGSGLYIDAVLKGVDEFEEVPVTVREAINAEYAVKGIEWLRGELKKADPVFYGRVDTDNPQRMIRALEVFRHTRKPFSSFHRNKKTVREFKAIKILLSPDRAELYNRINERVDAMIARGLVEEARKLFPLRKNNALLTVGYKELFEHFEGRCTLQEATEKIKQHTRNYAKRQLTWFANRDTFTRFNPSETDKIVAFIRDQMK